MQDICCPNIQQNLHCQIVYTHVHLQLTVGSRVKRGPDWYWGTQDRGGAVYHDSCMCVIFREMYHLLTICCNHFFRFLLIIEGSKTALNYF